MIGRGITGLVLLTTLVACGGSDESADPTPTASSTAPSNPSSNPSSAGSPATTPSAAPPASASGPAAKDGQNYKACADGTCEVLIRGKATLNLTGSKFTATVADGTLKLTDSKGYITLGRNGSGASRSGGGSAGGVAGGIAAVSWSDQGGPLHIATLTYAEGDTVVVALTTRK